MPMRGNQSNGSNNKQKSGDQALARQYYVNTGHARQRQALYSNDKFQVDSLYGINVAQYDIIKKKQDDAEVHITVPALVCCDTEEKPLGSPLCKPECLPERPQSSPGSPLSNKYMRIKCRNSSRASPSNHADDTTSRESYSYNRPIDSTSSAKHTDTYHSGSKNIYFSTDPSNMDTISKDSSTKMSAPTRTTPISQTRSTPEPSAQSLKTMTFSSWEANNSPTSTWWSNSPPKATTRNNRPGYSSPDASCSNSQAANSADYPPECQEVEGWLRNLIKTILLWMFVLLLYVAALLGLLVYMCAGCTAHMSVVIANLVLVAVVWCDSQCYHLVDD